MNEKKKGNVVDAFVEGAKNGYNIAIGGTLPNVVLAFALIQVLEITGLLDIIGRVFQPIMVLFGLPGVAATVLIGAWLSMGGGVGIAASLVSTGDLTNTHIAILLPAIYLMGSQVQYIGRIAGTIDIPSKYNIHMLIISIINAVLAMLIMNLFV